MKFNLWYIREEKLGCGPDELQSGYVDISYMYSTIIFFDSSDPFLQSSFHSRDRFLQNGSKVITCWWHVNWECSKKPDWLLWCYCEAVFYIEMINIGFFSIQPNSFSALPFVKLFFLSHCYRLTPMHRKLRLLFDFCNSLTSKTNIKPEK